ncbi:MAG: sugar phosphate isomerase/epimerase [Candidatus Brocadiaceae bacterium]|nr:sugar phosphate isomerase/epimerase [Candidatus Brocadiaceae bacterium]
MFFSGIADEAGDDLATQIKAHTELGWKHIELRNISGIGVADLSDRAFDEAVAALGDAGIGVSCFAAQLCNWSRPITKHPDIDRHELARAIPRMQRLGCPFIRSMSYPNAGWPEDEWRDEVVARLKVLARMAEDGGVTIVHENCNGWGGLGPRQTLELLERVDSPAMKLVWDTGNPLGHGQDPWEYYSAIKDHVVYVHIKEGVRHADGRVDWTYPGEGQARIPDVLNDLMDRGYDNGISIEPHVAAVVHVGKAASDAEGAYEKYVEYGRRLMALVDRVKAAR